MALLDTIQKQYSRLYQPSINLIKQQERGIESKLDPQREALRQARINAFRDIDVGAQESGLLYSGRPLLERGQYLGETFIPGLAAIEQSGTEERLGLLGQLNQLLLSRGKDVLSQYETAAGRQSQSKIANLQRASAERIARDEIRAILEAARI